MPEHNWHWAVLLNPCALTACCSYTAPRSLRPVFLPTRTAEDMIGLVRIRTAPATRKDMPKIDRPMATATAAAIR